MSYIVKRIGLFCYGILAVIESIVNFIMYLTHLDIIIKPVDSAMPFYFWFVNKFLKNNYISKLKDKHGQNI